MIFSRIVRSPDTSQHHAPPRNADSAVPPVRASLIVCAACPGGTIHFTPSATPAFLVTASRRNALSHPLPPSGERGLLPLHRGPCSGDEGEAVTRPIRAVMQYVPGTNPLAPMPYSDEQRDDLVRRAREVDERSRVASRNHRGAGGRFVSAEQKR